MTNHKYIYYLIGSSIVLVIINTVFYLIQASQNQKNHQHTLKTLLITETANSLFLSIRNAETGQRGYLLTGNDKYLQPYTSSEKKITQTLRELQSLTSSDKPQALKINELKRWINLKRAELALTIELKKKSRSDLALEKVNTGVGKYAMDKIESLINAIISGEKKRMETFDNSFNRINSRIQVFTIAGSYVLLVIIIASLITVIRNREQIIKLFVQVDEKNKLLEFQKKDLENISNELLKQNGELERFAYIASHDLRSPGINLTSLLNLYEKATDPHEKEEFMQAVKSVASNLLVKLDDLIELLRKKAGLN